MIQIKIVIICCLLFFCAHSFALDISNLEKFRSVITTEFKGYDISSTENIQLYGAKHRKFITDQWYWGEAGYGALFGKRSGYLEGGVFIGHMSKGPGDSIVDIRLFTGAGGGGSAPQGGGFIVHPTIGLGKAISSTLFIMTELGYMHFVNGDISSISLGISINMNMWHLKERIQ
jgi:hypothetical protein